MDHKKVYLDYNATTPLEPQVLLSIHDALENAWGNPSSSYTEGVKAKEIIQNSRKCIAKMICGKQEDIIFTSGGTEANNMVLNFGLQHFKNTFVNFNDQHVKPHFITSNLEHDSVKLVLESFEKHGLADVSYVPASCETGRVEVEDVMAAVRPTTCMITIMMANNETGVIQPIEEIMSQIKTVKRNSDREVPRILLHTDAAQAIGKIAVDVNDLCVDYLTIVGHKFYGPRIGALYARQDNHCPIYPMFYGGGQEKNYRPGTENTGMIAGLGKAANLVIENISTYKSSMRHCRDYLENQLTTTFLGNEYKDRGFTVHINGKFTGSERIPNTCNFSLTGPGVDGVSGRTILSKCQHLVASVGAACHSGITKGSHILLAIGVPQEVAINALRLSVGRHTTKEDIDIVVADIKQAIDQCLCENGA